MVPRPFHPPYPLPSPSPRHHLLFAILKVQRINRRSPNIIIATKTRPGSISLILVSISTLATSLISEHLRQGAQCVSASTLIQIVDVGVVLSSVTTAEGGARRVKLCWKGEGGGEEGGVESFCGSLGGSEAGQKPVASGATGKSVRVRKRVVGLRKMEDLRLACNEVVFTVGNSDAVDRGEENGDSRKGEELHDLRHLEVGKRGNCFEGGKLFFVICLER